MPLLLLLVDDSSLQVTSYELHLPAENFQRQFEAQLRKCAAYHNAQAHANRCLVRLGGIHGSAQADFNFSLIRRVLSAHIATIA